MNPPTQIHIPKTGGESITRTFAWKTVRHKTLSEYSNRTDQDQFITILRCPFDRAVSIYRYFEQTAGVDFNTPARTCHRAIREMIVKFCDGPSEFWEKINPVEIHPLIPHFKQQAHWLEGGIIGGNTHLYDFGDFLNEIQRISREHNARIIRTGIHAKKTIRRTAKEELSEKAIRNIAEHYPLDLELMAKMNFPLSV
jgi:hypothetical protein